MSAIEKEHSHTTPATYVKIAIILAVITLVELAYPYATVDIKGLDQFYMPILGALSLVKFFIVLGYFMHLKFDPAVLKVIFAFSLVIATGVMIALMMLFDVNL